MGDVALRDIVEALGGELIGDGARRIERIGSLDGATPSTISFLVDPHHADRLKASKAGCVIVAPASRESAASRGAAIVTSDPYLYYALLTQWWTARLRPAVVPAVHASALIDGAAQVAASASIGAFAVIDAGASIGDAVVIGAHCVVGAGAHIGARTRLAPRVTIGERCCIGERCLLHSGVVIGADGFGFAATDGRWEKIEQLGAVRIGNDVEIGANTCIDRGALDDTLIEDGVKLDNQIQIGHNVRVGAHTAMAGCVGVAGSTRIGAHCTIGGAGMISGHLTLADHVHISAGSVVIGSISRPGTYTGIFPIDDNAAWGKNAATLRQLHALRERLRALEKKSS